MGEIVHRFNLIKPQVGESNILTHICFHNMCELMAFCFVIAMNKFTRSCWPWYWSTWILPFFAEFSSVAVNSWVLEDILAKAIQLFCPLGYIFLLCNSSYYINYFNALIASVFLFCHDLDLRKLILPEFLERFKWYNITYTSKTSWKNWMRQHHPMIVRCMGLPETLGVQFGKGLVFEGDNVSVFK